MTDPMTSFSSFQSAFAEGEISPQKCRLGENLYMLQDDANGSFRITYAKILNDEVIATVSFVLVEPLNASPCFACGYAVDPEHRNQGVGTALMKDSIAELTQGLAQHVDGQFYIEAVVGLDNLASNKIARNFLENVENSIIDQVSGENAFHYLRLIKL